MSKEKLRVGLIGAGWWAAEAHLPALARHPLAETVAIQTGNPEKAAKLTAKFGIPHAFPTAEELLALPELDAVIISSTPNMHYAQAEAALRRGLHVLIEKPMTINADESALLMSLAESQGVQFLISCPWHYTAHGRLVRERIASSRLGRLRMVSMVMSNFTFGFYAGKPFAEALAGSDGTDASLEPEVAPRIGSYSNPATAGGGHIYCQASHLFAYLGFLTGIEPVEISARFDNFGLNVDATNVMHATLADDVLCSIATIATPADIERVFEVRVFGSEGIACLELWKGHCHLRYADGSTEDPEPLDAEAIYPKFDPALNFVDCALGKAPNLSPASLGHYGMRLIDGAIRSAGSLQASKITPL